MGDCCILLGALYRGPKQTYEDARRYYLAAEKIDRAAPGLPTWRAPIYMFLDWNWRGAEQVFKTEHVDLDPFHAFYLASQGQAEDALKVMQEYGDIGALPPAQRNELAMAYNWAGRFRQANDCAKKALELDPNFPLAYVELGIAYVQQNENNTAIRKLREALAGGQAHPRIQGVLGYAYAKEGKNQDAQNVLKELKESAKRRFGCAYCIAQIHAALGEKDQAFEWLHKACYDREPFVIFIKVDPTMDNLRKEPQFAKLLKDMGLRP